MEKVKAATKYQVKAVLGRKATTKTTTKTSYTIKSSKRKKTYKIYVRSITNTAVASWAMQKS